MIKLVGLYVLQAFLILGQGLSLAALLTGLWQGHSLLSQIYGLSGFIVCYLLRHGLTEIGNNWLDKYSAGAAQNFRQQLLKKVFALGPVIVQREGTGNMVTLALDGIKEVENYIRLIYSKVISMMIIPVIILVICFWLDWISGIVMLLVYPLIVLFMIILGYAAKAKADRQFAAFQILSNHFIDSLRGIDTLKYFGLSKKYSQSIYRSSEERIEVFYQPIYSTREHRFVSAEALVRMRDTEGKLVPPAAFISVAERNGKILQLGEIVFDKVCRFFTEQHLEQYGLHYIEVNLSVVQCSYKQLADDYISIMEKYRINPGYINLEITESASMSAKKTLLGNMQRLMEYGVHFSLDDFGTGQSNLCAYAKTRML